MKRAINCWCLEARPGFLLHRSSGSITDYQQCCRGTALQQAWAGRSQHSGTNASFRKGLSMDSTWLEDIPCANWVEENTERVWLDCCFTLPSSGSSSMSILRVSTVFKKKKKKNLVKFASKVQKECALQPNRTTTLGQLLKGFSRRNQEQENHAGNCRVRWQQWPLAGCLSPTPYMKVKKKESAPKMLVMGSQSLTCYADINKE